MTKFPQYANWAHAKLYDTESSMYDWQNMNIAEAVERALAICDIADADGSQEVAYYDLKNMVKALHERYPRRSDS